MEKIHIQNWITEQKEKWQKIKSDVMAKFPEGKDFLDKSYLVLTWSGGQTKIIFDKDDVPSIPSFDELLERARVEVRFPIVNKDIIDDVIQHMLVDQGSSYGIRVVIIGQMPIRILEREEVRTMQPIKKFSQDNFEVAIWENHGSKDGKEYSFRSLSLTRNWKDKNLQPRRDVIRLRKADVAKVIELLTKAGQEMD